MSFVCHACKRVYPMETKRYRCECNGLFLYTRERAYPDHPFDNLFTSSVWRYKELLPPVSEHVLQKVSMGEGGTPLISLGDHVWGKLDYLMPTLSFKDRGAVMLIAHMVSQGISHCVIDSSGNAATAVAAYSARVGISCEVFVPSHTSLGKIEQIKAYGATIHRIEGSREDTASAALQYVEEKGAYYASHIYNPLFWEGTKTYLFEIFEQLQHTLADIFIVPVGNGTLLLGLIIALKELLELGEIQHIPHVVAVQAAHCSPLFHASHNRLDDYFPKHTIAEGIAIAKPARGDYILEEMKDIGGTFITVDEDEIEDAHTELSRKGMFVEPTSAANYAAYRSLLAKNPSIADIHTVIPLCGSGLKALH